MVLKFLFGLGFVSKEETHTRKDFLVMARKTDILQHVDIARLIGLIPSSGGFVSKTHSVDKMHFYGESISCRVSTDSSMEPLYAKMLKEGSWWKTEIEHSRQKHKLWVVVPEGFTPIEMGRVIMTWTPSSHKEMHDTLEAEEDAGYGW